VDLSKPIDISIPLGPDGPRAWYVAPMSIAPVINAHFTGSVALGGSVNFRDVKFNPHGHGTHTETVGHITKENYPLSDFVPDVMHYTRST
jgi:arylformamidase